MGFLIIGTVFAVIWIIRLACWLAVRAVRLASKGAGAISERLTAGD